jgi:hydroxymethylbilane synthase
LRNSGRDASEEIVIATRGSALALSQARIVEHLLSTAFPELTFSISIVKTKGDKILDTPLPAIPGKGVFVKEIEDCLLEGRARLAVHSMKDLPVDLPRGLHLAATPKRDDFRDVLVSRDGLALETLPESSVVGTSSPRRRAQLLAVRPDLRLEDIRGNLDTRLAKLHGRRPSLVRYDAIIVAAAGCHRLALSQEISQYLPPEVCLPAAGQGAIAIECREGDPAATRIAQAINDPPTFASVGAERAVVRDLGGGCHTPIAALAIPDGEDLALLAAVLSPDGGRILRAEAVGKVENPESLARTVAARLMDLGAEELLDQG